MNARTVRCPSCQTALRVPALGGTFRCPHCKTACRIPAVETANQSPPAGSAKPRAELKNPPVAASKPGGPAAMGIPDQVAPAFRSRPIARRQSEADPANQGKDAENGGPSAKPAVDQNVVIALAAGFVCLLLIGFAVVFLVATRMSRPDPAEVAAAAAADAEAAEKARREAIVYRTVDLPEPQRQQIFRDMKTAADSSVNKKIFLPKDSQTGQFVRENLQKIVDREGQMHSLMNNIPAEDVAEIMKEGDAKGWGDPER